ncbi:MAG: histidine phosphatase family protein [Bacilli bacterium]|nr:histidine phosphatase family protein [Bacilli bacterium]
MVDVYNRIKSFLNDMFNLYSENEKILIVTHNAFIRSLKRLFIDKDKVEEPKNVEIFRIDNEMYQKMLEKNS